MKIELNISKKHMATMITAMLIMTMMAFVTVVSAKEIMSDYPEGMPYHEKLYTDIIGAKDETVHTISGKDAHKVTLDDHLEVTGTINGIGAVPSGFCIISPTETQCPEGWEDVSGSGGDMEGRTMRGDSGDVGGDGGSEKHQHDYSPPKNLEIDGSHDRGPWGGRTYQTEEESSWPPYRNVIVCCRK
ncbi:MAG: hypothetical protein R6U32_07880 [Candidatus Woesearchaeota archaeon]